MMHVIGTILLAMGISFYGIRKSQNLSKRVSELKSVLLMLHKLKSLLLYAQLPTYRLIETLCETEEFANLSFLQYCRNHLTSQVAFQSIWEQAVSDASTQMHLAASDAKLITDIGSVLGASDIETQTEQLSLSMQFLRENLNTAETEYNQKGKLYRSLGVFAGIGTAIVLL